MSLPVVRGPDRGGRRTRDSHRWHHDAPHPRQPRLSSRRRDADGSQRTDRLAPRTTNRAPSWFTWMAN